MPEKDTKQKKTGKIVRIAKTDIDASLPFERSLWKIKGVSFMFAHAVRMALGYSYDTRIADLSKEEIKKIEDCILNPSKYGIPSWLYNRRKDRDTGKDLHLTASDLEIRHKFDIEFLKKIKCYRGIRHILGLPCRGQRTRAHFRRGQTVGVTKGKKK